ncbi:Fe-S cluster assembly scaffold protein NifU [Candidatus Dependentiae bacterium]|nr:Fe-S cluster assembly scaffold protein NifU [Candidatus Dependentiae bacterium]
MTNPLKYSKKVIEHFTSPKNMGEIENADGVGEVGNPICGDIMKITIKVEDNIITDIKFLTFGCVAAIATSSVATTMVKGKTLDEAELLTRKAVADALNGLPPIKLHCSNLAADALYKAIVDYKKKHDIPLTEEEILKEQKIDEEDHV